MIIILKSGIGDAEIDDVCRRVTEMGYAPHIIRGEFKTIVAAVGEETGPARSPPARSRRDRRVGHARPAALQAREP